MKVTLRWVETKEKEGGKTWDSYFPKNATMRDYDDLSPEANNELFNFLYSKYSERSVG